MIFETFPDTLRTARGNETMKSLRVGVLLCVQDEASWVNGLIMACDGGATA